MSMKKMGLKSLMACLLAVLALLPVWALAEAGGSMRAEAQVSTGPGEQYALIPDVTLERGQRVSVRTQYTSGGETWVQVEFSYGGGLARGYVRSEGVNASLRDVPREAPLCTARLLRGLDYAAMGPVYRGYIGYPAAIRQGASAVVYEVEDGSALIEYWNYDLVKKSRSWVPLTDLETDMRFTADGYYGVAQEDSLHVPAPTKAPSTYYGSVQRGYPVGVMCTVVSGSCHIKEDAGAEYRTVGYAYVGERYEVLECMHGSSGKDWYRIKQGSVTGWISSGLVSLD